jgi:hypothetical protein
MERLIQAVMTKQYELGETDLEFSRRLGISRQAWQLVRTERGRPGHRTLKGIVQAFPDLQFEILAYLLAKQPVH